MYHSLLSFAIFSSADWMFEFNETLDQMTDFSIWNSYGMGNVGVMLWRLMGPNSILYGIFGALGFDSNIPDRFLVFWPWIFLSGLSSYLLAKEVTKSEVGGVIGFSVLAFNTYFLAINTQGHIFLSTGAVYVTFALLYFIRTLEKTKLYDAFLTSIFLFLAGTNDFRMLYIAVWIFFFYTVSFLFRTRDKSSSGWKNIRREMFFATIPIILVAFLNVFWILPSIFTGSLNENEVLGRSLFGNGYFDIARSLTLFHPFWTDGYIDWFQTHDIPLYFWLIPIFAFVGLLLHLKDRNIVFFGGIALLGIFLSKQVGSPFGNVYEWMYLHFPGFNAFREASKFYFITALGYSILIASFGAYIHTHLCRTKIQRRIGWSIIFLMVGIFFYNSRPIIVGDIGNFFIPKEIPKDYLILKEFLQKQDHSFRTLWVPKAVRWSFFTNEIQKLNSSDIMNQEWKNILKSDAIHPNILVQEKIMNSFKEDFSDNLFDNASIRYIIVPLKDQKGLDLLFYYYGGENNSNIRNWYIRELDLIPWLTRVDIGTKELVLYENLNYKPKLYLTKKTETIFENISNSGVIWKSTSPTTYTVQLKNIQGLQYLNFSELFHPDWHMRIGSFNWIDSIIQSDYFIDDMYHTKSNANLNSFMIDVDYIKSHFPSAIKVNPDASITCALTLYFHPQSYFILGIYVSGFTLLGILLYLVSWQLRNRISHKRSHYE